VAQGGGSGLAGPSAQSAPQFQAAAPPPPLPSRDAQFQQQGEAAMAALLRQAAGGNSNGLGTGGLDPVLAQALAATGLLGLVPFGGGGGSGGSAPSQLDSAAGGGLQAFSSGGGLKPLHNASLPGLHGSMGASGGSAFQPPAQHQQQPVQHQASMEQQLRQLLQQQPQHQSQEQQLLQMLQPSFSLLQPPQQQQLQQAQPAAAGGLSQQEQDLLVQLHQLRDWAQLAAPQQPQQQHLQLFSGSAPAFQAPRFDASGLLAAPQQAGAAVGGSASAQAWSMPAAPAAADAQGARGAPGLPPISLQNLQRQALLAAGAAAPQAQLPGQLYSGPSGASAAVLPPAGLAPSGGLPSSLMSNMSFANGGAGSSLLPAFSLGPMGQQQQGHQGPQHQQPQQQPQKKQRSVAGPRQQQAQRQQQGDSDSQDEEGMEVGCLLWPAMQSSALPALACPALLYAPCLLWPSLLCLPLLSHVPTPPCYIHRHLLLLASCTV
jgi:hypothetical protein